MDYRQTLIKRMVNLLQPEANQILNMSYDEALECVGSGVPEKVRAIDGQFAIVHKQGTVIRMARSIGRPMRFFLAKKAEGPLLVVAERMEEIRDYLETEGIGEQFHPSYTRMVPAHYIMELALVGCPDPNPVCTRFLESHRDQLPTDLDVIGERYISAVSRELDGWLDTVDPKEPLGVMFSGGIDSGAILLLLYDRLLKRGESPQRLKAFTLCVEESGEDLSQASDFLKAVDLDISETIRVIEDYKPLDVQSATMGLALCRGIRKRYPDWKYLLDGDGGDENLRDYPIEENPELTIRSVLSNPFFYHEGWGVEAVKHSLTYSGGQSRGHDRTSAPASTEGFAGFSPFATPNVIDVTEGIPFVALTDWDHQKLYDLKGEITRRGVESVTGITMPIFEKRRFQRGFAEIFPEDESAYRALFSKVFSN